MSKEKTETEVINEKVVGLRAFFPMEDLDFKVGAKTKDKSKGKVLTYLNSIAVRQRLTDVFGPTGWKTELKFSTIGVSCRLFVQFMPGGEWIWREDVAQTHGDVNDSWEREFALKQGANDAFNRAAVLFGVGEYLYSLPDQWVPLREAKYWVSGKEPKMPSAYLPKDDKSKPRIVIDADLDDSATSAEGAKSKDVAPDAPATPAVPAGADAAPASGSDAAESKATPAAEPVVTGPTKEELDVIAKYVAKAKKTGTRDGVRAQVDAMNAHEGLSEAAKLAAREQLREVFKKAPKGTAAD